MYLISRNGLRVRIRYDLYNVDLLLFFAIEILQHCLTELFH